jgi:hypothetical protein
MTFTCKVNELFTNPFWQLAIVLSNNYRHAHVRITTFRTMIRIYFQLINQFTSQSIKFRSSNQIIFHIMKYRTILLFVKMVDQSSEQCYSTTGTVGITQH